MSAHAHVASVDYAALDDHALVAQVRDGHREAFRHIMQRCNQRLFRVARAVIGEDSEAEDVAGGVLAARKALAAAPSCRPNSGGCVRSRRARCRTSRCVAAPAPISAVKSRP